MQIRTIDKHMRPIATLVRSSSSLWRGSTRLRNDARFIAIVRAIGRQRKTGFHRRGCADAQKWLGFISDTFGDKPVQVRSPLEGLVIGHGQNPLVNQGDALVHIARVQAEAPPDPLPDLPDL